MPTKIRLYEKEIDPKQKCYFAMEAYDEADFADTLNALMSYCIQAGARDLYFTARGGIVSPIEDGTRIDSISFHYDTDFDEYEKALSSLNHDPLPLRMKFIKPFSAPLYQALYNEAFFAVPNSETLTEEDLDALMADSKRMAGFFMHGGAPAGTFELNFTEAIPEIAAISILEVYRGRGFGRAALKLLEHTAAEKGFQRIRLLAASKNTAAIQLYTSEKYQKTKHIATWFHATYEK